MSTSLAMRSEDGVGVRTLEQTVQRAVNLLAGVGTSRAILAKMARRGYSEEEADKGWALIQKACGHRTGAPVDVLEREVLDALHAIDEWDEPNFRIARAALAHEFPEQARFVFENLEAQRGRGAIVSVMTFLDRVDELEAGRSDSTKEADKKAVALLAKRGITKDERTRMRVLVKSVQKVPTDVGPEFDEEKIDADETKRIESLSALRAWYDDWSDVARAVLSRRDHLIRVGLAKRKMDDSADPTSPTDPTPKPS